jgi:hypothetical protein
MGKLGWCLVAVAVGCCAVPLGAQGDLAKDNEATVKQALQESVLVEGKQPFHLVMEIGAAEMLAPHQRMAGPSMHGSMEVWWAGPERYKVVLETPSFRQTKTVDGGRVEEQDEGGFYPRWLDNFVKALLEPLPEKQMTKLLAERMSGAPTIVARKESGGENGGVHFSITQPRIEMPRCLSTSDRPGGITEETSVARICLDARYPWVESALDFTRYVSFKDYERFGKQMVPRIWMNDIPENIDVEGKVKTLEKLSKGDAAAVRVTTPTVESGRMRTVFLSRKEMDGQVESQPVFDWPTEDTEALEGWMIVYVRTDRTGQIRESYWDSSDNYKLQDAGVELALKTKLKPLVVDGAAVQMEGPLVIHFKTHRSEPSAAAQ